MLVPPEELWGFDARESRHSVLRAIVNDSRSSAAGAMSFAERGIASDTSRDHDAGKSRTVADWPPGAMSWEPSPKTSSS